MNERWTKKTTRQMQSHLKLMLRNPNVEERVRRMVGEQMGRTRAVQKPQCWLNWCSELMAKSKTTVVTTQAVKEMREKKDHLDSTKNLKK